MHKLAAVLAALALALFGCAIPEEGAPDRQDSETTKATDAGPAEKPSAQAKDRHKEPMQKPKSKPEEVRLYPVLRVVDGDTVEVGYKGGVSVRIIGIDTPETVHPSVPDECWGPTASDAASRLLTGKRVQLVFDPSQGRTDAYDRTLAYVQVPGIGDFGLAMIRRGHAAEYTYDTAYAHQGRYQAAESRARAAGRGLWGKCGGTDVPLEKPRPQPKSHAPAGNCEPGYDPCVPPYPPDVDCGDVEGPIQVSGSDPHGLDADGDGVACES